MPENNLKDKFRQRFEGFEVQAPENGWDNIQNQILKKRSSRKLAWILILISFLVGSSLTGWYFFGNKDQLAFRATKNNEVAGANDLRIEAKENNASDFNDKNGKTTLKKSLINSKVTEKEAKRVIENNPARIAGAESLGVKKLIKPFPLFENKTAQDKKKEDLATTTARKNKQAKNSGLIEKMKNLPLQFNPVLHPNIDSVLLRSEIEIDEKASPVYRLGLYFGINSYVTYNKIEPNKTDEVIIIEGEENKTSLANRIGINASFGLEYQLSPKIITYGGLSFYSYQHVLSSNINQIIPTGSSEIMLTAQQMKVIPMVDTVNFSLDNNIQTLGGQLGVKYLFKKGRFNHAFDLNVDLQKILGKADSNFHPTSRILTNIGYRFSYGLSKKVDLSMSPNLSYSIWDKKNSTSVLRAVPFGIGLGFGISYKF